MSGSTIPQSAEEKLSKRQGAKEGREKGENYATGTPDEVVVCGSLGPMDPWVMFCYQAVASL